MDEVKCKCGEYVKIDGEYPKFFAYCDNCSDYVDSDRFDAYEYAGEYMANLYDSYRDRE